MRGRRPSARLLAAAGPLAATVLLGAAGPVAAQAPATPTVLTMADAVRMAVRRSPEVRGAGFDVEAFLARQQQADAARWPQLSALSGIGPSPEAERLDGSGLSTPLKSLNVREGDLNGVFGRVDLLLIQPIYTFGLIGNLRAAAAHGVKAQQAGQDRTAAEVALRVREAYLGLVLATEMRAVLADVRRQITRASERLQALQEGGFAADADVFRLRALQGELDRHVLVAERGSRVGAEALRVWAGLPAGAPVEAADARLAADLEELPAVTVLVEEARAKRPELAALRESLRAKRALVEAERARAWPQVFLGLQGSFAHATNRDRVLNNAYVSDPYRHVYVGPVLGLKYDLDFGVAAGRVREAQAVVGKMEALEIQAAEAIPLEVATLHSEVDAARRGALTTSRSHENARRWVVTASANFDIGVGETRDLIDAVATLIRTRGEHLQSLHAYRLGRHRLEHATGRDVAEVRELLREPARPARSAEPTLPAASAAAGIPTTRPDRAPTSLTAEVHR